MENIVRFMKGKKKGYIGYDAYGKVILARNEVQIGYYKISNIEEREKVILVDAERIPYDYFPDITYNEFLDVLKYNGFKIGFIEDFHYVRGNYESDDHLVFAYDVETHIVIVAQSWKNGKSFNSIDVYCPGMNCFDVRSKLFSNGNSSICVFNLCYEDVLNKNKGAFHIFKENMDGIKDNNYKGYNSISLWNYSEQSDNTEEFFNRSCQKIKRADRKDMFELFAQSKTMMKALNS